MSIDVQAWLTAWQPSAEVTAIETLGSGVIADVLGVSYRVRGQTGSAALRVMRAAGGVAELRRLEVLQARLLAARLPVPEPYAVQGCDR